MRNWLAVASADHVRVGRKLGFMQVSHGRAAPLKRVQPGDRVVCYSPTDSFRGNDRLQAFTAIGTVKAGKPYRVDMAAGFQPYRRDVAWHQASPATLVALQGVLELTREANWGYRLRRGLIEISERDMTTIAEAMFTGAATSAEPLYRLAA